MKRVGSVSDSIRSSDVSDCITTSEVEMFCPKCAAQNVSGASFCRVCGANISLVPQALSGELSQPTEPATQTRKRGKNRDSCGQEANLENAFRNAFMGIAFLLVAMALSFSIGRGWWFWMLIPAFSFMGKGVAQYIRVKEEQKKALPRAGFVQPVMQAPANTTAFQPQRNTGELIAPPPSVTEGTTRHLGVEAPTRHLEEANEVHK
jgi:hypothetical protein